MKILVTGIAGFIGFHVAKNLLNKGNYKIIGIDNLNNYYDVNLKIDRLKNLGIDYSGQSNTLIKSENGNLFFIKTDIENNFIINIFEEFKPEVVIHLAAQAGVRYSLENPFTYIYSNIVGFTNILESIRKFKVNHLIFASSSSVYGLNSKIPFSETDCANHPVSLYAATKRSGELIAHSYSYLFNIPTTCLRFFTVYGPWGRPDMALFTFVDSIINNKTINLFNYGEMFRDFTYIDDVVAPLVELIEKIPHGLKSIKNIDNSNSVAPFVIYNIGGGNPVKLTELVSIIEKKLNKKAKIKLTEMQKGDIVQTYAKNSKLKESLNFIPTTKIEDGIEKFINWYLDYYRISN
ncbi:MAG: NAD-dependent epimerase/dehydratase family protein [Bacteroidales bacterium]|nr:NAD-dependent epimerase/dehydratase family protein [Bacteroidales bacterium]